MDWELIRWGVTTVIAVGALVLTLINMSRTWRYRPHWTPEASDTGPDVVLFNRTNEDATQVTVTVTRVDVPRALQMRYQVLTVPMVPADGSVLLELAEQPDWLDSKHRWEIIWVRATTRRRYVQPFIERDTRTLRVRLREGWRQFRRDSVRGRRVRE